MGPPKSWGCFSGYSKPSLVLLAKKDILLKVAMLVNLHLLWRCCSNLLWFLSHPPQLCDFSFIIQKCHMYVELYAFISVQATSRANFYVYVNYTRLKAVLNNRPLIFFFWKVEIKYKSLFKVISVCSGNNHFNNIFIFWVVFHCVCMGVPAESTHFNLIQEKELHIIIL